MGRQPMDTAYPIKYNETSADRTKKYTINLPFEMWDELKKRTGPSCEIRRVSIYIKAVLSQHLRDHIPISMDEIINARKESLRVASADHRRERQEKREIENKKWWTPLIRKGRKLFSPKQNIFDF